ncbi:hypothetical protein Efla_001023 [Eimeria flavescens]
MSRCWPPLTAGEKESRVGIGNEMNEVSVHLRSPLLLERSTAAVSSELSEAFAVGLRRPAASERSERKMMKKHDGIQQLAAQQRARRLPRMQPLACLASTAPRVTRLLAGQEARGDLPKGDLPRDGYLSLRGPPAV